MRLEEYQGYGNNKLGLHWTPVPYHAHADLTWFIDRVTAMGIGWVILIDDGGGSTLQHSAFYNGKNIVQMFQERNVEPVIRYYASANAKFDARMKDTTRRLVDQGVRYVFWQNEPEVGGNEYPNRPKDWVREVTRLYVNGAYQIMEVGAYPGAWATTTFQFPDENGNTVNPYALYMSQQERDDIFKNGSGWIAIHPYPKNHPLNYPYDDVNQNAKLMTHEEYMYWLNQVDENYRRETGHLWVFDDYQVDEHHINFVRTNGANPGQTLYDTGADVCFWMYKGINEYLDDLGLLEYVPILGTEAGPVCGVREDGRYPKVTPQQQIIVVEDELNEIASVNNFFCIGLWLVGGSRLSSATADGFEGDGIFTDRHNFPFGLQGELPIVPYFIEKNSNPPSQKTIRVKLSDGTIETVDFENYVKSVLPNEMPALWETEALKAQAILIRNYANWRLENPRSTDFDLYADAKDQVYDPTRRTDRTDEIVDETKYLVYTKGMRYISHCGMSFCPVDAGNGYDGKQWPDRMCQYGAQELAKQGYDYQEILDFYFDREEEEKPMKSKLCPHIQILDNATVEAIKYVQPPMVKTMDVGLGALQSIRQAAPDTLIVARYYLGTQDFMTDPIKAGKVYAETYYAAGVLGVADVVEVYNEAVNNLTSVEDLAKFDDFQVAFAHRVWELSPDTKIALFVLSTGNWGYPGEPTFNSCPKSMALPKDKIYLCVHEYSWNTWDWESPARCLRYRTQMVGLEGYKLLITECGLTHAVVKGYPDVGWRTGIDRQVYLDGMKWYDAELKKDDYVVGAAVYLIGPSYNWDTFESRAEWVEAVGEPIIEEPEEPTVPGEPETINAAEAYGVTIQPADVEVGDKYWKAVKVHHLTPEENNGQHHIFLDVLKEDGSRYYGAEITGWWGPADNEIVTVTVDKPANEPGTNIVLSNIRQVTSVACVIGNYDSDFVVGMHTNHPDEGPVTEWGHDGNTVGHHSFLVVYQLVTKSGEVEEPTEPEPPTEEEIRNEIWNRPIETGVIAYNIEHAFPKKARELGLGAPLTETWDWRELRLQKFSLGGLWTEIGNWQNIKHVTY